MSRPENTFTRLGGVTVHYDRTNREEYGTRGRPATFHATTEFEAKLDACFVELWNLCPLGRAEIITSAGAYTNKPGQHGAGAAFDIDGIFWANKTFVTLHDGYNGRDRKLYLAVEAVLRRHFGVVLNFAYNADHRDHFHVDASATVNFARVKSKILFVQLALKHVLGVSVDVDGEWGQNTETALAEGFEILGLTGSITTSSVWKNFLLRIAERGFAHLAPAGLQDENADPLALLRQVYETVSSELQGNPSRKTVETALNTFALHPDTQAWLEGYR